VARSLIIGRLGKGMMVISDVPRLETWVRHASLGLPLIYIAHDPHIPIRQEQRNANVLSM